MESHKVDAHGTKRLWQISDRQNYPVATRCARMVLTIHAARIQKFFLVAERSGRAGRTWNV